MTSRNSQKKVENDDLKSAAFTAPKKQKKKNQKGAKGEKSVWIRSCVDHGRVLARGLLSRRVLRRRCRRR